VAGRDSLPTRFEDRFDAVLAMGLFDYVGTPRTGVLEDGLEVPEGHIASFSTFTMREQLGRLCRDRGIRPRPD
jgi:hypothetical protein